MATGRYPLVFDPDPGISGRVVTAYNGRSWRFDSVRKTWELENYAHMTFDGVSPIEVDVNDSNVTTEFDMDGLRFATPDN